MFQPSTPTHGGPNAALLLYITKLFLDLYSLVAKLVSLVTREPDSTKLRRKFILNGLNSYNGAYKSFVSNILPIVGPAG